MGESLDNLAQNLPSDQFGMLEKHFEKLGKTKESTQLLRKKANFPYSYVNSFEKLEETELPSIENWTNSLNGFEVSVSREEYERAHRVYQTFECQNLGQYYDIYLTTDVYLLAAVVSCFREICYTTYGLDCCQYFSASNLPGEAMVKHVVLTLICSQITVTLN